MFGQIDTPVKYQDFAWIGRTNFICVFYFTREKKWMKRTLMYIVVLNILDDITASF